MKVRKRGEEIRHFILENLEEHPSDIATLTAEHFGITRQAVNKHIQYLIKQNSIEAKGTTRNRCYELAPLQKWVKLYSLQSKLEEDVVWIDDVKPLLVTLPDNVRDIWAYAFTEMLNNAIDHSSGRTVEVKVEQTAKTTQVWVCDDGEGIFQKIQRELGMTDERHAVLELSKGKLTTDPANHSGQGIFFTSRMMDHFDILSGGVYFGHSYGDGEDWIIERRSPIHGTCIIMELDNNTSRTSKQVFDHYTTDDDYGFTKTVVPVLLAQYGDEKLVSRSQAKRLLVRVDRFKVVIFDFSGVEAIGQAFADEVFRVFKNQHPEMQILAVNANPEVEQMISRASHE